MFKNEQILFLAKFFKQENKDSSFKDMTDPDNLEDYIVRKWLVGSHFFYVNWWNLLFTFLIILTNIIVGDTMKKLNSNGWGMDTMISFLIAFVIFLIIVVFLTYKAGAM